MVKAAKTLMKSLLSEVDDTRKEAARAAKIGTLATRGEQDAAKLLKEASAVQKELKKESD